MTRDNLKERIKKIFGTYSRFCKLAKMDRYEFQRDFLEASHVSAEDIAEINGIVASLKEEQLTPAKVRSKLGGLRRALKKAGGVPEFCRNNPEFPSKMSVYMASYGRTGYYQLAVKLIKHFDL